MRKRICPVCTSFKKRQTVRAFTPLEQDGPYSLRKGTTVCKGCGWGRLPDGMMFSRQARPTYMYGQPFHPSEHPSA